MNCVAYLRVSSADQTNGTGFDRQLAACTALAERLHLTITEVFREDITGKKEESQRPVYQQMLQHLADSGTRIILVEHLDRLARLYRTQESMLSGLVDLSLTLYAANTGENVTEAMQDTPMRKALVQIQGIFAELDRSQIVLKLRKGREITKAEKGRCEGQKPFGHYEDERYAYEIIHGLRDGSSWSCEEIAANLNDRKIPSRSGRPWSGPVIAKILRRERIKQYAL